jgi:23S rRNA (adenine2503-C2)-methyltransferase
VSYAPRVIVRDERGRFNRRFAVKMADGALVEAVLYRDDTLCVSSQVGCAVRCPFCASGANGLGRSLRVEEIVAQVEEVEALLRSEGQPMFRGVTLSGIGEPLHAHEATRAFLQHARKRNLRVTLTTSGGPLPRLREWLVNEPHQGITISIHAGNEETRKRMVPHGPDLESVFALLREEVPRLSRTRKKRTALAYLLVAGENDADPEIDAFVERARPLDLFVHLYAYNPVSNSPFQTVERARYEEIHARMSAAGLTVRMSAQARIEANGGCGTLVALRPQRDVSL